jgi:hypothetical protein
MADSNNTRSTAIVVIVQTIAGVLALFSSWSERVRALLALLVLFLFGVLARGMASRGRRIQTLSLLTLAVSIAASALGVAFILKRSKTVVPAHDVELTVQARSLSSQSDGTHGLIAANAWSQSSVATVGDTIEWQLHAVTHGYQSSNLSFRVSFPAGVTVVNDPTLLQLASAQEFVVNPDALFGSNGGVVVRATVDAGTGGCPGTQYFSARAQDGPAVVATTDLPLVIFDPKGCAKVSQVSAGGGGWSPNRRVWDWNLDKFGPTSQPVLNSYINTPSYGDERGFLDAKLATQQSAGGFVNVLSVSSFGDRVLVRFYVINDANESVQPPLVARRTRVQLAIPAGTDRTLPISGRIDASNVQVSPVNDTLQLVSDEPFRVEYVPGSAVAYSNAQPRGTPVSDSIAENGGALIGSRALDGDLLPDFQGAVIVTAELRVLK